MISIIMNCHNGTKFIRNSISSVVEQTYKDWELIVWDNASQVRVEKILEEFPGFPIKYYYCEVFLPLGMARNRAIEKAKGEFIAFLDVDDVWYPTKLEEQLPLFADPLVGLVFCQAHVLRGNRKYNSFVQKGALPSGFVFARLLENYFLVMSTVILRKEAISGFQGPFDKNYEIIEELDLFLRLSLEWKVEGVVTVLAAWRWHSQNTTFLKQRKITTEKRRLLKTLSSTEVFYNKKNRAAFERARSKVFMSIAINQLAIGKSRSCRRVLLRSPTINKRGLVIYFLSFLPLSIAFKVYETLRRVPLV